MPVDLFNPSANFGVKPGRKRVVSCEWMIHQFTKKDGTSGGEPFLCLAVGYLPVDESGKAIGEAEVDYSVKIGKFGKPLSDTQYAPAEAPGKPLPLRLGSRGNYIEPIAGGTGSFSKNSKAQLFIDALLSIGGDKFRQKMSESQMNIGILVGTVGHVFELSSPNDGIGDDGKAMKDTKITVFNKIDYFGWEAGAAQGGSTTSPSTAGAQSPANGTANGSGGSEALAIAILEKFSEKHADKASMPLADMLKGLMPVTSKMNPRPQSTERDAAKALMTTAEFWESDDVAAVATYDPSNGLVEFAR